MSKGKYTVVDSEGIERTYYGCATVNEACLLGDVSPNNVTKNANQLLTFQDCFENPEYGVTVRENSVISYSVELAVAYEDLIPYEEYGILPKVSSLKLGVLSITPTTNNIIERACQPAEGNTDNCFTLKLSDSSGDLGLLSPDIFEQGLYSGRIDISILPRTIHMPGVVYTYNIPGLDIVLCNFIEDNFDSQSLVIRKISLTNMYEGADTGTSTDFINQDVPEFAMTSNYESIVASSGSQKLCAFTRGMSPHQASLQNKYSDWLVLTLANFMLMFGHEIKTREFDTLASVIEVEFFYVDSKSVKQVKTLNINVWFKAGAEAEIYTPTVLPENDSNDEVPFEPNPYTIFYRTVDKRELVNLNDDSLLETFVSSKIESFAPSDNRFVSRGYNEEKDYGWIKFELPIYSLSFSFFRIKSSNLLGILAWPTMLKGIFGPSYAPEDARINRFIAEFPKTLYYISDKVFYAFGLTQSLALHHRSEDSPTFKIGRNAFALNHFTLLTFSVLNPEHKFLFDTLCFSYNYELKTITGLEHCIFDGDHVFLSCHNLESVVKFYNQDPNTVNAFELYYLHGLFAYCENIPAIMYLNTSCTYEPKHGSSGGDVCELYGPNKLSKIYIEGEYTPLIGFGGYTFRGCAGVRHLYCNSFTPPYMGINNIRRPHSLHYNHTINPDLCKLYVPVGRKHAYNSKAQWGDFPLDSIIEYTPEQFEAVKQQLLAAEQ